MVTENKELLSKSLAVFNFGENVNVQNIFDLLNTVDSRYRNFSIFTQVNKILFMPYLIVFLVNGTVVLKPFLEAFELIKTHVFNLYSNTKDEYSPRIVINGRFLIIDVFPSNKLRYNYGLYSMSPTILSLNETNIEKIRLFTGSGNKS